MAAAYGGQIQGQFGHPPPGPDPQTVAWFHAVDTDHSGHITSIELQQALTNANWTHFNQQTCRLMIGMFDHDRSGTIGLHEFQALWSYILQWRGVFDSFDSNRSGHIDANEFRNALSQMGYNLSPQFCNMVIWRYDFKSRCHIGLDDFIQVCVLLKSITDTFRQKDTQMSGVVNVSYDDFMCMAMSNKP